MRAKATPDCSQPFSGLKPPAEEVTSPAGQGERCRRRTLCLQSGKVSERSLMLRKRAPRAGRCGTPRQQAFSPKVPTGSCTGRSAFCEISSYQQAQAKRRTHRETSMPMLTGQRLSSGHKVLWCRVSLEICRAHALPHLHAACDDARRQYSCLAEHAGIHQYH